jgi:Fanconi anemia group M protein
MVKIIVDYRELRSNVAKMLFDKEVEIDTQSLQVGDFLLSDDVCVELKKVDDFVGSLIDGRLFAQAKNLKSNFKKPIYIIEGDFANIFELRNVHPNAIRAALVSLLLDYQIPFLFANTEEETAELLHTIARREQEQHNKEVSLRGGRKLFSFQDKQQYFIEGLPLIGPGLAKNLLKHFGSCSALLNATHEDLQKVDKVGKKKAEAIRNILDEDYFFEE